MTQNCSCNGSAHAFGDWAVSNIPMADEIQSLGEFFPKIKSNNKFETQLQNRDIQSHKFQGSHNGLPLDSLRLFSSASKNTGKLSAERRFIGKMGSVEIDYTMHVEMLEDFKIEVLIEFRKPVTKGASSLAYVYDLRSKLLISTTPDIRDIEPEFIQAASTPLSMVKLASSTRPFMLSSRIHCILHIVIHVGAAIIPAYILCAGPAVAAAIVAC